MGSIQPSNNNRTMGTRNALHQDILAFDTETKPDHQAVRQLYEFKPELVEFDPDSVKTGNIKDPVKKKQKIEEAEAKFKIDQAKEEYEFWDKLEKGAALNGATCQIIALGFCDENGPESYAFKTEADLLKIFWDRYEDIHSGQERRKALVGHNIFGFDLPVMIQRSWVNKVSVPRSVRKAGKQWWNELFIDTQKEFNQYQYGKFVSLKRMAKMFGVAQEREYEITGENFWMFLEEHGEDAIVYLDDDCQETYDCANIILNGEYPDDE